MGTNPQAILQKLEERLPSRVTVVITDEGGQTFFNGMYKHIQYGCQISTYFRDIVDFLYFHKFNPKYSGSNEHRRRAQDKIR